jgi:hypothetical protein
MASISTDENDSFKKNIIDKRVYSRDGSPIGYVEDVQGNNIIIQGTDRYREKIEISINDVSLIRDNVDLKLTIAELNINGICPLCNFRIVNGRCGC